MGNSLFQMIFNAGDGSITNVLAQQEGMRTLRQSGLDKARQGITSLAEINRVTNG